MNRTVKPKWERVKVVSYHHMGGLNPVHAWKDGKGESILVIRFALKDLKFVAGARNEPELRRNRVING